MIPIEKYGMSPIFVSESGWSEDKRPVAFRNVPAKCSSFCLAAKASIFDSTTYHSDLAPTPAIPLEAKQLLAAVQAAWVFGGMGSWNDLGFDGDDQREYDALSGKLFLLINQTLCSAINTTSGAAGP